MEFLAGSLLELITETSTNLPPDVRAAMSIAAQEETPGTQSSQAFDIILSNVDMASDDTGPICQDTGMPTFVVRTPVGVNQIRIKLFKLIWDAIGSEFGGRHELYEINYSGNHEQIRLDVLTGARQGGILDDCIALAEQCMSEYDLNGWKDSTWLWDK